MVRLSRRSLLQSLASAAAAPALAQGALAQGSAAPPPNPFRFDDVVRRARELAAVPFDAAMPPLPEPLARLDFDAYRDVRFRPDRALLGSAGGPFRMHLFHLGFLYQRPVTVNVIRDGVPMPVAYQPQFFDYGRTKIERPLPINLGFAGFRLHYPLNDPRVFDELIAFLGSSYFRFLGRGQRYGLSARALAVNVEGEAEEFPFLREFWVELPPPGAERAVIYALLDSASTTGAYRFEVYPGAETTLDVAAHLFPRRTMAAVGLAPLTSMFFEGENDRNAADDFRPELHDSDGLLLHTGSGEWIWRPLHNPAKRWVSAFIDNNPRGFGLMQRDRIFENYQDLEAQYHLRPGYWVEPTGPWGEGQVKLLELPTGNETIDNIVAFWQPKQPYEPGQEIIFTYRMRSLLAPDGMHPGGKVVNTFQTAARASGSHEPSDPTVRRFLIDFAGGSLAYHMQAPEGVQIVPSASVGKILQTFVVPNEPIRGFRAAFDVKLEPGQSADLRAYLRVGNKALTETWTYPWTVG